MDTVYRRIFGWLTLADYDAAKVRASQQVVARFSRGNVSIQNGWVLDEKELDKLSMAGDKAMSRLERGIPV